MKHLITGRGRGQRSALAENCQRRILVRYHYPAMSGSSGGAAPATRRAFLGFIASRCRAAADRRRQQGRAARALQPAYQGCARGCAGEAPDILQGCAEPRLRPEALIADRSYLLLERRETDLMILSPVSSMGPAARLPQN